MFTRPSSPKTIGGMLDDAFRLYGASWRVWIWPAVLSGLIQAGLEAVELFEARSGVTRPLFGYAFSSPTFAGLSLLAGLIGLWLYGTVLFALDDTYNGREPSARHAFAEGGRIMPSVFGASLVTGLGVAVALIALIVPGLILAGRWMLSPAAIVAERKDAMASLRRSSDLVSGNWWRSVTTVSIALIIVLVLFFSAPFVAGVFYGLTSNLRGFQIAIVGLMGIERVITMAAWPAAMLVVFYDLRLRKEGSDLSARVEALGAA